MTESGSGSGRREDPSSELERLARAIRRNESDLSTDGEPEGNPNIPGDDPAQGALDISLLERYRGTFIHPDLLGKFDECINNGAERAFAQTEREQAHRHECDRKLVDAQVELVKSQVRKTDAENRERLLIIILAFVFVLLSTAAAFTAVMTDHPVGVGIAGGGALLAAIGLFARVRKLQSSAQGDEAPS